MADGEEKVKLSIRNPCLDEAKEIEAPLSWTVLQVKEDVEKNWPEHPRPADQRLIYSGKLLQDDSSQLKDVLRLEEGWNSHTIHLVCRQLSAKANAKTANIQNTQGIRHRQNANTPIASNAPNPSASSWQEYLASGNQDQQQIMMQQMYAHYLQQYIQYVNHANAAAAAASGHQDHHQMPQQLPVAAAAAAAAMMQVPQGPPAPQITPEQPQPPPADAGAAVPAGGVGDGNLGNAVMNAGAGAMGAMEDDDEFEGGQRDLLDWLYVASRVIVLFSIVYFYSSFARFALVMGFGLIIYLYRIGFFGAVNNNNNNQEQVVAPPVAQQDQAENGGTEEDEENSGTNQQQVSRPAQIELQQPWYRVAATFVTTFFTSLMPAEPQRVI